ncbi:L,D-transpeptidase [Nocardioides pyridinolyticus]
MSRHRAEVRPRYGRLAVLATALAVTAISVLAGTGVLPSLAGGEPPPAAARQAVDLPAESPSVTPSPPATTVLRSEVEEPGEQVDETALPARSGTGRRVVFSESRQRVWLVDDATDVRRTYLVSGSTLDNLDPGTYEVYSTSRWAVGIDDSGVMEYFVRFTRGPSGAAIGFHTIPTKDGAPLQTKQELGTPQSHGCIRQRTPDAIALWDFAPVGTTVVVTA